MKEIRPDIFYKVDIVVTGAGQAGLSAAYISFKNSFSLKIQINTIPFNFRNLPAT